MTLSPQEEREANSSDSDVDDSQARRRRWKAAPIKHKTPRMVTDINPDCTRERKLFPISPGS
jgi:hypothetical protein